MGKNTSIGHCGTSSCVSLSPVVPTRQQVSDSLSWRGGQCSSTRIQWCSPSSPASTCDCDVSTDHRAASGSSTNSRSSPPVVCTRRPSERLQRRPASRGQLAPTQSGQDVLVVSEILSESPRAWTTGQGSGWLRQHVCSVPGPSWTWFLLSPALDLDHTWLV